MLETYAIFCNIMETELENVVYIVHDVFSGKLLSYGTIKATQLSNALVPYQPLVIKQVQKTL